MNNKKKKDPSKEETNIDLKKLEELIISYTQEVIDYHEYAEILKDKEEVTKTYKKIK